MTGKVYLVGAGPGDYKLLTLKAKECLEKADVIVYDRLANEEFLKLGRPGCEYINVGKAASNHTLPQDQINALLAQKAEEGKMVVRLKGGDPYVFGRGGEEGEYLFERNIDFEVVPGITSAIGGLCYAGIPITHRDVASSFHVITGHFKEGSEEELDWETLAKLQGTLVFLMGMGNLEKITSQLTAYGKSVDTPVALVSWATRYNQKVVTGTLENICDKARSSGIKPPTLIAVGDVVRLRDKLNFFEHKSLFGKRIVVTRTRSQSSGLIEMIRDLGGKALEFPTIEMQKLENNAKLKVAIKYIKDYTCLVFTSPNAVEVFFEALDDANLDSRSLAHLKIAAIGNSTNNALKTHGICADIMPPKAIAESLADTLVEELSTSDYVLLPNSMLARDHLAHVLHQICKVDEIHIYNTVAAYQDENAEDEPAFELSTKAFLTALEKGEIDYVTFTSSSIVHHFVNRIGRENILKLEKTKLVSIGDITSRTLEEYGMEIYKQAEKANISELVKCMCEA